MNTVPTENINANTADIDLLDSFGVVSLINQEDLKVAQAVNSCLSDIAKAVDIISENFLRSGRLLYFGAGTSGRLGVLDASECPPTFNTDPEMVQGIIAGGDFAIKNAVEGAEDSVELARADFSRLHINQNDTIVVISASGNANYVVEILAMAKSKGCKTVAVTSNKSAKTKENSDVFICIETGAEPITGSTRMKAGTAQKMVLNMLTTASMVKIGKVYGNYMIDVKPTNLKLKDRAARFVAQIANVDKQVAVETLEAFDYKLKPAILKLKYNLELEKSEELITKFNGVLRKIFNYLES